MFQQSGTDNSVILKELKSAVADDSQSSFDIILTLIDGTIDRWTFTSREMRDKDLQNLFDVWIKYGLDQDN